MTQQIGLFGGSFNPIHNGHLHIAHAFANQINLSHLIFLPAGKPYHKNNQSISGQHRLNMTQLAIENEPRFALSDCDIVRKGNTYTYDTIQIFRQHFPQAQLWWLMGLDSLMQLHTWHKWHIWVEQVHIALAMRSDHQLKHTPQPLQSWLQRALHTQRLVILDTPVCDISSSQIREALSHNQPLQPSWLPQKVINYIHTHQLYSKK